MQERGGITWTQQTSTSARVAAPENGILAASSIAGPAVGVSDWASRLVDGQSVTATSSPPRSLQAAVARGSSDGVTEDTNIATVWNTRRLGARIGVDAASAACAGVLVAPIITVIDKGIIENATGRRSLGASFADSLRTLAFRPHSFFFSRPFALIFTLYTGTYLTANSVDTISSTVNNKPSHATTHGTAKFAATSAANLTLCLWKDTHFTRLFSTTSPRPVPMVTYSLFAARDCLTIFASFNLPPVLAPRLPMHLLPDFMRNARRENVAQFIAPAAVQVFSTPLHLLGLDFYNRNGQTTVRQRWEMVRRAWGMSCLARVGRIVPAFGVGGVVNSGVRRSLMQRLE